MAQSKLIAISDLVIAFLLLGAVWGLLPARWMPIDAAGTLLALAFGIAGVGLLAGAPWAPRVAKIVAGASLVVGGLLSTGLAFTAAHLSGLYGPVGSGGALLLFVVALLILPYLVLVPLAQLWVLLGMGGERG